MSVINEQLISVPASTEHLAKVRDFVGDIAKKANFPDEHIEDIRLAVDEACTNVIKHAYKCDSSQLIRVKVEQKDNRLVISLLHTGCSFDPGTYKDPNIKERVRNRKRGGMGLYLIKKLMDKVEYRHVGASNEIRMTKLNK